jgi:hypothetical protein
MRGFHCDNFIQTWYFKNLFICFSDLGIESQDLEHARQRLSLTHTQLTKHGLSSENCLNH